MKQEYKDVLQKWVDKHNAQKPKSKEEVEAFKHNYKEIKYLLEEIDTEDVKPQLLGGLNSGWYLVNPKTLEAVDSDDYMDLSGLEFCYPFDILDDMEAHPEKSWQKASKNGIVEPITSIFQ